MAYTAQNIIDMAQYRNLRNKDDLIDNTEALRVIDREQRKLYIAAARENPEYFGTNLTTAARAAYTDSWDLSGSRIAAVTKLVVGSITGSVTGLTANTTEINLVHSKFPTMMPGPRAYIRGRQLTGYGTDLGGADANMVTTVKVYYSPFPAALSTVSSAITLPDEWADLLVLPLARIWAIRDGGRKEEADDLLAEYGGLLALFVDAVKLYDIGAIKPLTAVRPTLMVGGENAGS